MNDEGFQKLLEDLKASKLPSREAVLMILESVGAMLQKEPNIVKISGDANILGDLHGQFYDLLNILHSIDLNKSTIFLGDYVDRGCNSVEVILTVLLLKILNGKKVVLLRGNHENRSQTEVYGFKRECTIKYDLFVYWKICEVFEYFPIAAIVNDTYFCIHGGICPEMTLEIIRHTDRLEEYSETIGPLLWSDPDDGIEYFEKSSRGAGFIFGEKALIEFLKETKCKYLVRSHQLVLEGIKEDFDGLCITVWSAPNYCYKQSNMGAVMVINNNSHDYVFFEAVDEQYKEADLYLVFPS